jgi:hypothetical protein
LPFEELTAFRDAVAEEIRKAREQIDAATVARQRAANDIFLVQSGTRRGTRVESDAGRSILRRIADFLFVSSDLSPKGTICVLTVPENGASVSFYPRSAPHDRQSITSASRLTLWLGRYVYEISRSNYAPTNGEVDLLLNVQRVLECPLSKSKGCSLLGGSVEEHCR